MAGTLSKRQTARNEKTLHDLVQSVPGNNFCADCQTRNPGVFLCMRCAAIHRKLGTHVSKVKSLSMDSWSNEQVDNMRKVGNAASNKIYNPQNKKPPVPIDADEVDSAMERFIRQKYMGNGMNGPKRHNTGSTESDEGTPPPLPPKTPTRFGFRSASSIFPLSSKAKKEAAAAGASHSQRSPTSPPRRGKSSHSDAEMEHKLAQLHDMGFTDEKRNTVVLKGVNGSLERAIEALVRLGEGDVRSPTSLVNQRESSLGATRSLTSVNAAAPPAAVSNSTFGLSRDRAPSPSSNNPFNRPPTANNPFDLPAPAQPQSSQSTGTLQNKNPYHSTNPFGMPNPQADQALAAALQNLSLAAPQQALFPHHTGGVPMPFAAQQQQPAYYQQQQQAVPQNYSAMSFNNNQTYPPPQLQPQHTGYNPFFSSPQQQQQQQQQLQFQQQLQQQQEQQQQQQQQQQPPSQPLLSVNTAAAMQNGFLNNPFTRSPTRIASPTPLGRIPEQAPAPPQSYASSPAQQAQPAFVPPTLQHANTMPASLSATNPFFGQPHQQHLMPQQTIYQVYATTLPQNQPQMQPLAPQYTAARADKASIMALYNYPQLAPTSFHQRQSQQQAVVQPTAPVATTPAGQPTMPTAAPQQQTAPAQPHAALNPSSPAGAMAGSKNPFLTASPVSTPSPVGPLPMAQLQAQQQMLPQAAPTAGAGTGAVGGPYAGASRESVMGMGLDLGWTSGRHSPDAFASLSARSLR